MMVCRNHPEATGSIIRCSRCLVPFCSDCIVRLQGHPYCGDCKDEHVRDLASGVDSTALEVAGVGKRFAALFVDSLIIALPTIIAVVVLGVGAALGGKTAKQPSPLFNLVGFVQVPFMIVYEGLMLGFRGQTLGKMALKVKVVRPDGTPISRGQAWGRAVTRGVFLSFLALINYLPAFFTKEKTCVHDLAARTRVISIG